MNIISIDLESWVHKYFTDWDSNKKKERDNGYICDATSYLLKVLKEHNVKTTFFIISEVFDWYPWLIHKIKDHGHELGFHTHTHRLLTNMKMLKMELESGKDFIDMFGPKGFRAPQAYIKKDYFPVIKDWGFTYDSSIYSDFKVYSLVDGMQEVPISTYPLTKNTMPIQYPRNLTVKLMIKEIPFGSGYFFGILGSRVGWFIRKLNKKNIPASLIIHPWQIVRIPQLKGDIKGSIFKRIIMLPYERNRREDLKILLQNHEFVPIASIINTYKYKKENSVV